MLSLERQQAILQYLKKHHTATVQELSREYFIGPASIRRDLTKLERQNLIKRTYGGAVLIEGPAAEAPASLRRQESLEAKTVIGHLAASLVDNNDIMILDSSTTTLQMIPFLKNKENLKIITNSLEASRLLGEHTDCQIFSCGGRVRTSSMSIVGHQAESFIRNYRAQKLFFSCNSITPQGLINANDEEAQVRRTMIDVSQKVIMLCDSNKFDKPGFCHICDLERLDYLITEKEPDHNWMQLLHANHVQVLYPEVSV